MFWLQWRVAHWFILRRANKSMRFDWSIIRNNAIKDSGRWRQCLGFFFWGGVGGPLEVTVRQWFISAQHLCTHREPNVDLFISITLTAAMPFINWYPPHYPSFFHPLQIPSSRTSRTLPLFDNLRTVYKQNNLQEGTSNNVVYQLSSPAFPVTIPKTTSTPFHCAAW